MAKASDSYYEEFLYPRLRDTDLAVEYLNASLEEGRPESFLTALGHVAQAHGIGMSDLAKKTQLNRKNLYTVLSENGNPEWKSLNTLLEALGFGLQVKAKRVA